MLRYIKHWLGLDWVKVVDKEPGFTVRDYSWDYAPLLVPATRTTYTRFSLCGKFFITSYVYCIVGHKQPHTTFCIWENVDLTLQSA